MRVVLSQRIDTTTTGENREGIDQNWHAFLDAAFPGVLCFPMPSVAVHSAWLDAITPDLILLTGGNDVGQNPSRDLAEQQLLTWALERDVPVIGICRGAQFIALKLGAHLSDGGQTHVAKPHDLLLTNEAPIHLDITCNSFHRWLITTTPEWAKHVAIWATDTQGYIEAFAHQSFPWFGLMWHPERETPFRPTDLQLFRFASQRKTL